jgi:signal transduction histidine kinase
MDSYPGPLTQVLTNLILNASIHAFEPGSEGQFVIEARLQEDQVELRATDNGRGIPPQDLRRIFEPFFTTRRAMGGTGLGLHIAHNIVTQILGGDITCVSAPGEGTTFRLLLPRVAAAKNSGDFAAVTKV